MKESISDPHFEKILKDYAEDRQELSACLLRWARSLDLDELVGLSPAILAHMTPADILEYHADLLLRNKGNTRLISRLKTIRLAFDRQQEDAPYTIRTDPASLSQFPARVGLDLAASALMVVLSAGAFLAARLLQATLFEAILVAGFLPLVQLLLLSGNRLEGPATAALRRASLQNIFVAAAMATVAWLESSVSIWPLLTAGAIASLGAWLVWQNS